MFKHLLQFEKKYIIFFSTIIIPFAASSQAPLQPTNITPATATSNYSGNTISLTVSDANGDPMTVKLYGRKKTCTSTASNFTVIGLPDTQFYTEEPQGLNSGGGGSNEIFKAQTQWIAANRTSRNIEFVVQLGDCVQNGDNPPGTDKEIEWRRADTAMKNIENPNVPLTDGIPYGICVGNHDETPAGSLTGTTALFNQYFGNARFSGRGYYGGSYGTANNNNHYELFSSNGMDFIHISIEYFADGTSAKLQGILDWADALLKTNPGRKGILSTHNLLGTGNPANFQGPGQKIYDDLKDNPNLFLMLAGHVAGEGRRSDTYNGNTIYSLMSDYQSGYTNGGNGYLRIMEFRPSQNIIDVKTYSPYNATTPFLTGTSSQFTIPFNTSCPFALIGTNNNVASGNSTTFTWPGLALSTEYEWYVTIDDGNGNVTTSAISNFTTWNGTAQTTTGSLRFTDTTYVNLGNAPELKLTNFTLEAWVKIEGYGSTTETGGGGVTKIVPIITKGRAEGETADVDVNYFLGYESGTNKLMADFEDNSTSANHPVTSAAKIPMNTWTHVGASFDVASRTWRLFIGATTETSVLAATYTPQSLSNRSVCIGSSLSTGTTAKPGFFNGRIDEVRIWNTALTSLNNSEITSGAGLVGRWGFGDGTGTTVTNSVSGGANGTIVNNYEWVTGFNETDPTTNASIDFNGVHDYVTFSTAASINSSAFTLEGWLKREGTGITTTTGTGGVTAVPIITKGRGEAETPANLNMNYFFGIDASNKLTADFEESTGPNHPITGNTAITNNVWTHVAVTYEPVTAVWNLYINGVLDKTLDIGSNVNPVTTSIQHAAIGSALTSTGVADGYFDGKLDEVRIWSRALTQAEIQANMNNEITSGTGLLGRWGFNENGDSTVNNSVAGAASGIVRSTNPDTHPTNGAAAWVSSGFTPTVTTATTTTTAVTPTSIEYGTTSISFTATVTANPGGGKVQFYVDGTAVGAPVTVAAATGKATLSSYSPALLNVGSHTVRGDFAGNGSFAANIGTNTSFTVTPAVLTYTATGASRPYGAANPAFTGTVTGFKNSQTQATATTGTLNFSSTATTASTVGNYAINGSGLTANNGNYTFAQAAGNSTALIITAAILTYTANVATRIYGDTDPAFSGTITGFVNGDTQASATTGSLTFTTTATVTSSAGTWPINGSGLTANSSNYEFANASANSTAFTITKRPLDFSGARTFINGNSTFSASQLTPGNIANNDVLSIGGSATVSSPNVGTYASFVANSLTTTNTNYQVTGGTINVSIVNVPTTNHKSLRFTDTSYVDLGNTASLHLTNFTIEAWIKIEGYASTTSSGATGTGGGQDGIVPIITKGRAEQELASVDVNYLLSYRLSDRKLVADFEDNATSKNHSVTSAATIPMNTWTHVGASFDVASQTWRLFIDNNAAEVFTLTGGPFTPQSLSDVSACIGSTLNNAGGIRQGFFNGRIDEVRIWNTALTVLDAGELTSTPANLVGRWALDEGSGSVVSNTVVNGPSGTLVRNSEWVSGFNVTDSTTDASIRFNGVHDYVSFGAAPSLNSTSFTLEAWIYREGAGLSTSTGTGGVVAVPIIAKGRAESETPNNVNMNYFLGINSSNQLVADFEEPTGPNHPVTGIASIPNNTWTHVAVTYNSSTGVWNLYVNGALDKTITLSSPFIPVNTSIQHAAVGSALNSTGVADGFFNGKIDEVKIWGKALAIGDLQPNADCPLENYSSATGLLGHWGFNENGNITAANSKAGGVNGTLISNNISVNPTNGGPSWACNSSSSNYYRSKNVSGVWSQASDWEIFNGTSWTVATKPPGFSDDVVISSGTTIKITASAACKNLTVSSGGKLWKGNGSNTYISVYGHIICNGVIGNGATTDGISFNIEGDTCSISGTGTFDCSRIRKYCNANVTTKLTFNRDVNLRYTGTAIYNDKSSTIFNIKIPSGITVNCLGNNGSVAIHGVSGVDLGYQSGSLTVSGTLNLAGAGTPTLYLNNTNNTNASWPVSVVIDSIGIINTGIINCSASGVSGHSFIIRSGGKLNLTGEPASYVAPSFTNNNYTLESGSIIEYSKAGNQTVYTFGSLTYSNLFASGSGTKSITAPLGVTDTVKVMGTATLASGGNLTLLSSAAKTARVAEIPVNGAGTPLANITGNVTVERFIPAHRAWRLLTIPVINSNLTINGAWQEGVVNTSVGVNNNPNPGYGTHITGIASGTDWLIGYDAGPQNNYSLKVNDRTRNTTKPDGYSGLDQLYPLAAPGRGTNNTNINFLQGYMLFVRGDRSTILSQGTSAPLTNTILRAKGTLKTGTQAGVPTVAGFNLIGNPFASTIDLRKIRQDGAIPEFVYVYDPRLGSIGAFNTLLYDGSNYNPVLPGTGSYGSPYNISANSIESGQAFFVQSAGTGSVIIKEDAKEANSNSMIFSPVIQSHQLRTNLYAVDTTNNLLDATLTQFSDGGNNAVDGKDAMKIPAISSGTWLGMLRDGKNLVIERRQTINANDTIFYNLMSASKRKYRFEFIADNLDEKIESGFLEDSYLKKITSVSLNGTTTSDFSVSDDPASLASDRFRLVFRAKPVLPSPLTVNNINAYQKDNNVVVDWIIENEKGIKSYDVETSLDGKKFEKAGTLSSKGNSPIENYQWLDVNATEGVHYYRISYINGNGEVAYSKVVEVTVNRGKPEIVVYPNPVINARINIRFTNQPKGNYMINLIDNLGRVLIKKDIYHIEPDQLITIKASKNILKGAYRLEIIKPDNSITITSIILH